MAEHEADHRAVREDEEVRRVVNRDRIDRKERNVYRLAVGLIIVLGMFAVVTGAAASVALVKLWERDRTIEALGHQLDDQTSEIHQLRARTGELADQVVVLQVQLAELGVKPAVTSRPNEATPPRRSTTPTTAPTPPTSTTTTTAPPNPEPEPPPSTCIVGICVGFRR